MPKMQEQEINRLIEEQILCRIAFRGDSHPYIAPFQYVVINGALYFHFTDYGKKMSFFDQGAPVCVEIEKYTSTLSKCAFVILVGKLKKVTDPKERKKAIEKFAHIGGHKLSPNFLIAHGFSKGAKWQNFTSDKAFVIIKLDEITEKAGLKLP